MGDCSFERKSWTWCAAATRRRISSDHDQSYAGNSLLFRLSLVSPAGLELSKGPPGDSLAISKSGSNETVTLYGHVLAADFKALPAGFYSVELVMTVEY